MLHISYGFGFNPKEEEPIEELTQRVKMTGFMWYKNISGPYGENRLDGTQ